MLPGASEELSVEVDPGSSHSLNNELFYPSTDRGDSVLTDTDIIICSPRVYIHQV